MYMYIYTYRLLNVPVPNGQRLVRLSSRVHTQHQHKHTHTHTHIHYRFPTANPSFDSDGFEFIKHSLIDTYTDTYTDAYTHYWGPTTCWTLLWRVRDHLTLTNPHSYVT